jgi:hypothetical protein
LQVVNAPSDGAQRRVANSIGIVADIEDRGVLSSVAANLPDVFPKYAPQSLFLDGFDQYELPVELPPEEVEWTLSGVGEISEDGIFYSESEGEAVFTGTYGGFTASKTTLVVNDPAISAKYDYNFTVFGAAREPATLFDMYALNNLWADFRRNAELHAFVGGQLNADAISPEVAAHHFTSKGYNSFVHKTATMISVNNARGSLAESDPTQWAKLEAAVANLSTDKVFFFFNNENLSADASEAARLKALFADLQAGGKKVLVFSGGAQTGETVENGVTYLTGAGVPDALLMANYGASLRSLQYWVVEIRGKEVSWRLKGLWE